MQQFFDWILSWPPHWFWLTLAALFAAAEMLAPGFFLIWMAAAALLTGFATLAVTGMSMAAQALVFAGLAILLVVMGRRWFAVRPIESADPDLNKRGARLVGQVVFVVEALSAGEGRVRVGDSIWSARGIEAPEGAKVRITGVDGSILIVESM